MDNLQLISEKVNQDIDPDGAPGSILAKNHNEIVQMILRDTGKYVGLPYLAKGNYQGIISNGSIYFSDTMNNDLTAFVSLKTVDNTDFKPIIQLYKKYDVFHLKDFNGRSVYFWIDDIRESKDDASNDVFEIDLKPFLSNINYAYLSNDSIICVIEFMTSGGGLNPENYDLSDFKNEENNYFVQIEELNEMFSNFQPNLPILIQSQKPIITDLGGNTYNVNIPGNNTPSGKSIWQNPAGEIKERITNYSYVAEINMTLKNRIDVVWVGYDGSMGHEIGDEVDTGQPTPYPSNKIPQNSMQYTFITFINGNASVNQNLTIQQVQEIVNNAKPKRYNLTGNETLGVIHENSYIKVIGHCILTIPVGLLGNFFQCFFYITAGSSLTIAIQSGVTIEGYYSLTLNALERGTLTKDAPNNNHYLFT